VPQPPVEVYCKSVQNKSGGIVVETEVYPHGFSQDQPFYINTRWQNQSGDVSFKIIDFGGKGNPDEPQLNGAAVKASAEEIRDTLTVKSVDDSSSHPVPDVGWVRVDSNGNRI
jgi:hypothetical protein